MASNKAGLYRIFLKARRPKGNKNLLLNFNRINDQMAADIFPGESLSLSNKQIKILFLRIQLQVKGRRGENKSSGKTLRRESAQRESGFSYMYD